MKKVLLDTDIGNDSDDLLALTYLLKQKECDLRGIMTVSGDVQKRAALAKTVCGLMKKEIPIFAGSSTDFLGVLRQPGPCDSHSPLFPKGKNDVFPKLDAGLKHFRDVICENPHEVTLIVIGPETNVALLFITYPEVIPLLRELYIMGGSFFENPICTFDLRAEWNIKCDPLAAKVVLESNVENCHVYGVDLTWNYQLFGKDVMDILGGIDEFKPIYDVYCGIGSDYTFWFHDPLTCAAVFIPNVDGYKVGRIKVVTSEGNFGHTDFIPDENGNFKVYREFGPGQEFFYNHYRSVVRG